MQTVEKYSTARHGRSPKTRIRVYSRAMKHLLLVIGLVVVLPASLVAAACGDDDPGPPLQLEQQDRDQITRMASDYLAALATRDMAKAMAQLPAGVPSATVTNAMNTYRDEGYQDVSVGDMTVDGQQVTVTLNLKDKAGEPITRTFEFKIDKGEWKLWSPQLKLPT